MEINIIKQTLLFSGPFLSDQFTIIVYNNDKKAYSHAVAYCTYLDH